MFPFCHNSCWLLGKSFANCENLTDYCSISSFVKANKSLTWKDGVSIAYNVGTGAISGALDNGISTMVKIVRNPIAKWILKEGIGIILEGVESAISKMITGKSIDVKAIVAQTLISKGFGHILPIAYIKKGSSVKCVDAYHAVHIVLI